MNGGFIAFTVFKITRKIKRLISKTEVHLMMSQTNDFTSKLSNHLSNEIALLTLHNCCVSCSFDYLKSQNLSFKFDNSYSRDFCSSFISLKQKTLHLRFWRLKSKLLKTFLFLKNIGDIFSLFFKTNFYVKNF